MKTLVDQLVHDARGPLNAITMNAELAQLLARSGANPERLQQALAAILRESQRCNGILEAFREQVQGEQAE